MQYSLSTQHLDVSEEDRTLMDKKLERLEKLLVPPFVTSIRLTHDTHHSKGEVVTCTMNIEQGSQNFHAERQAETVHDALDEVLEALQQEIRKHRDKTRQQQRRQHNDDQNL